jgi:surface antigen
MKYAAIAAFLFAAALGACSTTAEAPPPSPAPAAPAGPPPVTGWLAGPDAQQLDESDRQRAFAAQITAADTGRRASWRSSKGHFGFVDPGAESANCRTFTHTLYIDGVAKRGGGTACRASAGGWQVS